MFSGRYLQCMSDAPVGDPPLQGPRTRPPILQDPITRTDSSHNIPRQDSHPHTSLEDMETQEPSDAHILSHASTPASSMGSRSSKRKRGKARGIPRPNNEADILFVRITNGGVVAVNRNKFTTKLGVFVKDQKDFPFWQRDYESFPLSKWDDMARVTREYFDIVYEGNLAEFIKKNCRKIWNDTRSQLYRIYYEPYNHDDAIKRIPPDMRSDTWIMVCNGIFSQSWWKTTSNINIHNRTQQQVVHVSGRTPFTQRTEDLRTQLGREPKRVELWDRTHVRRDGTFANAHTQAVTTQMTERIEQARQTSENVDEDIIFGEVLGPETRGRVRGLGSGISRRDYFSYQHPLHTEMQRQLQIIQSENEKFKSDYEQLKSDYVQLKSEHEQVISKYERIVEENEGLRQDVSGLQKNFDSLSQLLHQNSFATMSQQMPYQNYIQLL